MNNRWVRGRAFARVLGFIHRKPPSARASATVLVLILSNSLLHALPADRAISQYVRHAWTIENDSAVRGVAQTSDGYIWLATYEGLVRFDGENLRVLDRGTHREMQSNSVVTMARTADDTLWLGTLSGLMRYRGGRFETIALPGGEAVVHALTTEPDGSVWAGTATGMLVHVVHGQAVATKLPRAIPHVTALESSPNGLWIGTAQGLLRNERGVLRTVTSEPVVALLRDGDDGVYAGTSTGLDHIEGNAITHIAGLPVDQVTALQRDRDGNVWIGTYGSGVYRMSGSRLAAYGVADGLLNPTIRAIFEDAEGNLWIGSNGGVEQLRAGAFVSWGVRDGLDDNFARVIFQDREGVMWAGTAGGVYRWDSARWNKEPDPRLARILAIAETKDGTRWYGTSTGLIEVARDHVKTFTTADGLANNTVREILEDRRGDLWLATDGGISRMRGGVIESIGSIPGYNNNYVMAIAEAPDGRIWFTSWGGLIEYDGREFRAHVAPRELPSNHLLDLTIDDDGSLWLATEQSGVVLYRDGHFTEISTTAGLPLEKVLSIVDDGRGALWLGTAHGVVRATKHELHEYAEGKRSRVDVQFYDESDGLGSRECNGVANPAALRSRDGRVWFATAKGVAALAERQPAALPLRKPVLERVMIDGTEIPIASLTAIRPGVERMELQFSTLTFVAPQRVRMRYRLDGNDTVWSDAGTSRIASYTNLAPGDYRLIVESSRDGVRWNSTAIPFTLRPRFYQARWFLALCAAVAAAFLYLLHSLRLRLAQERAEELQRLVEERTREIQRQEQVVEEALARAEEANRAKSIFLAATSHELRTPLNAIIGFSNILMTQAGNALSERQNRFLSNIHDSGQYLLGIINNILDLSKVEAGKMEVQPEIVALRDEIAGICAVMKGVTTMRNITVEVEVSAGVPMIEADPTLIKQILYNLISNAVKFSPDGSTVRVIARDVDDSVEIRVEDEGVGIDVRDHELIFQEFRQAHAQGTGARPGGTGLGLSLVKRFAEMHGGEVRVESEIGKGSTFIVTLPVQFGMSEAAS